MPLLVALEQVRILHLDHRRAGAAGHNHRPLAREHADRMLRLLAGQRRITAVEHRLPAASLRFREVDLMPQSPQDPHDRLAGVRPETIAETGDEEGELHSDLTPGPADCPRRLAAAGAGRG